MNRIYLEAGSVNCACCPDIPTCRNIPKIEEPDTMPVPRETLQGWIEAMEESRPTISGRMGFSDRDQSLADKKHKKALAEMRDWGKV